MIRLVAFDLDGTLLNGRKELPPDFYPVVRKLTAKGIRFAAASGRQAYNLMKMLEPLQDEIAFISLNGTQIFFQGKIIFCRSIPPERIQPILEEARNLNRVSVALGGVESTYYDRDDTEFVAHLSKSNVRMTRVPDLGALLRSGCDRICHVSVYDGINVETNSYPALKHFEGILHVVPSGTEWLDVMMPGINKGVALRTLQDQWKIAPVETLAFGDYLNDLEMILACRYGYAMANAHPDLKAAAPFLAPSNEESGVMVVLERLQQEGKL